MTNNSEEAKEKIIKAKILLLGSSPFFSYMISCLRLTEDSTIKTFGINSKGHCYYNPDFAASKSPAELQYILAHEVMHAALYHPDRVEQRDRNIWGIAADLVVNTLLDNSNQFAKLEFGIHPTYNDTFELQELTIYDVSAKTAEEVYEMLTSIATPIETSIASSVMDKLIGNSESSSMNEEANENNDSEQIKSAGEDIDWTQVMASAAEAASRRGDLPGNMKKYVGKLLKPRMHWKQLLTKYVVSNTMDDYSYSKPHKRMASTNIFFPKTKGSKIDLTIAIDTSGSISNKDLQVFLSELNGVTKQFKNVNLRYLQHDTTIVFDKMYDQYSLNKIFVEPMHGGGGTSHKKIFELAYKTKPQTLICFTDGYSDIEDCKKYNNTIFVLVGNNEKMLFGKTVHYK